MFVARATTFCRLQRSRMFRRSDPLKHVFFLKRDVEFPQQTQILAFECLLCMVLSLIHDVSDDSVELRPGIRECAIAFLPRKSASDPALLVDPFIGISTDVAYYKHTAPLGQGDRQSRASTSILPRWGSGIEASGFDEHTAPLGQRDRGIRLLQAYCPAGAGGSGPRDSTNILPRWGRGIGSLGLLHQYCPAGAGGLGPQASTNILAPLGQADWDLGLLHQYCPAGAGGLGPRA